MGRYVSAVIMLLAAAGVYVKNLDSPNEQVFLWGTDLLVGNDPFAQGQISWQILLGLGLLWLGLDVWGAIRGSGDDADQGSDA